MSATEEASMRWDNLVEKNSTAGNSALFAADAVTTRTFDTPEVPP
ncbi:hypothetical protein SPW_7376 [Streptomyces sp. W007]|nr:hypothetical protein [Streptomyces sp. W007]EHM24282.1 hypothetical protein SPW_7376 [Streptomyces sp. W007]